MDTLLAMLGGGGIVGLINWARLRQQERRFEVWTTKRVEELRTKRSQLGATGLIAIYQIADVERPCAEWAISKARLQWDPRDPERRTLALPDERFVEPTPVSRLWT